MHYTVYLRLPGRLHREAAGGYGCHPSDAYKIAGHGFASAFGQRIPFRRKNPFPSIHPETVTRIPGWKNSQLYYNDIDFPQLLFQAYKAGRVSQELCMEYFRGWGRDTNSCSPVERKGYFALLTGEGEDGLEYVVADGNGNFDFTDDRVQPLSAATSPVKVVFERFDGNRPVTDSSWILPKRLSGDEAFCTYNTGKKQKQPSLWRGKTIFAG